MISWSTKYDPVAEYHEAMTEECMICSESSEPVYVIEQGYFKLYGLPLGATKRIVYKTCLKCNTRLKAKRTDGNINDVNRAFPKKLKFKYFWGWIVLLPIILGIIYLVLQIKNM